MAGTYKGAERRRSKRVRVKFIATYKLDRSMALQMGIGDNKVDVLMLDLSENGMAVSTKYDIPVSTVLLIEFTLINLHADEDDQVNSISITGEVRNNILAEENEQRLGISFTRISKEDKSVIAEYVKMTMDR